MSDLPPDIPPPPPGFVPIRPTGEPPPPPPGFVPQGGAQQQAAPVPPTHPGFLEKILSGVMQGNVAGLPGKSALEQSAEISAKQPYRPGMTAGQMMGGPQGIERGLQNPMLYGMGTGNIGRGVMPGRPQQPGPAPAPGAPPQVSPPGPLAGIIDQTAGSDLGSAIASKNPAAADEFITSRFRSVVKPSRSGIKSAPALKSQDRDILTSLDSVIENRQSLQYDGPNGQPVPGQGRLPRTMAETLDAFDQVQESLFARYDQKASTTEGMGIRVDLAPVVAKLRGISGDRTNRDVFPGIAKEAEQLANNLEKSGSYTPTETQMLIRNMNRILKGFYKNASDSTSLEKAEVMAPAASALRDALTEAIENAGQGGAEYRALREQWGRIERVKKDLAGAVVREGNKIPGGLGGMLASIGAKEELLRGIVTLNPAAVGRAGALQGAKLLQMYVNSPNRAIMKLFERRAGDSQPLGFGAIGQALGPAALPALRDFSLPSQMPSPPPDRPPRIGTVY